jgi:hypothetical protein
VLPHSMNDTIGNEKTWYYFSPFFFFFRPPCYFLESVDE